MPDNAAFSPDEDALNKKQTTVGSVTYSTGGHDLRPVSPEGVKNGWGVDNPRVTEDDGQIAKSKEPGDEEEEQSEEEQKSRDRTPLRYCTWIAEKPGMWFGKKGVGVGRTGEQEIVGVEVVEEEGIWDGGVLELHRDNT